MAGELSHKSCGTELTQAEFEAIDLHLLNAQATGDIIYASSATQLSRLAKGTDGQYLKIGATIPEWATPVPSGLIAMWHGTIANIPSGWVICDGNNSTPNLLAKFVEGVATAATNPGATGGATAKTLTDTASTVSADALHNIIRAGGALAAVSGAGAAPIVSDGIADIRPSFYDIAFLMKT